MFHYIMELHYIMLTNLCYIDSSTLHYVAEIMLLELCYITRNIVM